ncbi:MAG: putative Zn-dependent protease [Alphaproteobacteria bacterium]|jgi:predicted Zn-dependent protease
MKKLFLALILILYLCAPLVHAKAGESVLMDSETIDWMRTLAEPLLEKADIDPKTVNFYLIKSDDINAFVTPGRDIFFYSGLILKATSAEEVQGVLAHEIGHIKGNHYIKSLANQSEAKIPIILSTLLGAGAAALGSGDAAIALIYGGLATSQDQYLRHSRSHERQADSIAASLLNQNNRSTAALISFFDKLRTSNLLYSRTPPAWLVTHPLPSTRISAMQGHLKNEKISQREEPLNQKQFLRIQAKLNAFTKSSGYNLRKYAYQESEDALYARTITVALQGKIDEAILLAEAMNPQQVSKPFHYELLAQLYQDKARYKDADKVLQKALDLNPDLNFIRLQLAQNNIILEEYDDAIKHLHIVSIARPTWSHIYKSLGIAHGKKGELFESHLYLAKEAALKKNQKDINLHLQIAKMHMTKDDKKQQARLDIAKEMLTLAEKS